MAIHLIGRDISLGWLKAVNCLLNEKTHSRYNIMIEIQSPRIVYEQVRLDLDNLLLKNKKQSIETVANTIFPNALYNNSSDMQDFFRSYLFILKKLKRSSPKNYHGIYFERLINWPCNGKKINQLENIILRIKKELKKPNPIGVLYEALIEQPFLDASVHVPGIDNNIGFPCLSFLSFKLDSFKKINLVAVYRNHYFFERAYGNYLGLSRLLEFICKESNCSIGDLCILSTHGVLESNIKNLKDMISKYKDLII